MLRNRSAGSNRGCWSGSQARAEVLPLGRASCVNPSGLYPRTSAYDSIRAFESFEPWLHRVEKGIDLVSLETSARLTPREWNIDHREQLDQLLCTLDRRRRRVRDLIWQTLKAVPAAFRNFELGTAVLAMPVHRNLVTSKPGPTRRLHNVAV